MNDLGLMLISLCCFQIVMVVDARDPLFYRCLDLEVMLSFSCLENNLSDMIWPSLGLFFFFFFLKFFIFNRLNITLSKSEIFFEKILCLKHIILTIQSFLIKKMTLWIVAFVSPLSLSFVDFLFIFLFLATCFLLYTSGVLRDALHF
jgi:hypothetical protein